MQPKDSVHHETMRLVSLSLRFRSRMPVVVSTLHCYGRLVARAPPRCGGRRPGGSGPLPRDASIPRLRRHFVIERGALDPPANATPSIAALADRDGGRCFSRPIHGGSVTNCGGSFARITRLFQARVPTFDVAAVRGFGTARNGDVTHVIHSQERGLPGQRNWRGPIRR